MKSPSLTKKRSSKKSTHSIKMTRYLNTCVVHVGLLTIALRLASRFDVTSDTHDPKQGYHLQVKWQFYVNVSRHKTYYESHKRVLSIAVTNHSNLSGHFNLSHFLNFFKSNFHFHVFSRVDDKICRVLVKCTNVTNAVD